MNKKKSGLLILVLPGIIWATLKAIKYAKPRLDFATKIEKELTAYIELLHGKEQRKSICVIVFFAMWLDFRYPAAYLEANPNLEQECREYISEHYPDMVSFVKKISIKPLNPVKDAA